MIITDIINRYPNTFKRLHESELKDKEMTITDLERTAFSQAQEALEVGYGVLTRTAYNRVHVKYNKKEEQYSYFLNYVPVSREQARVYVY